MKSEELINKIIKASPHLSWMKDNSVFITLHGSRAYGTNVEGSDEDFKGVAIPPKQYFLGSQFRFEQAELKDPDTAIYEIRKFFNLAAFANPNILEVLFTDPSDHILVSPAGQIILDNKEKFLSKKVKFTFSGYAISQLKRMRTHRSWLLNPLKAPPTRKDLGLPERTLIPQDQLSAAQAEIKKELDKLQFDFMDELGESAKIMVRSTMEEMLAELKITTDDCWVSAARKIGFDDNFIALMQKEREYTGKKREWDQYQFWKANRNEKRAKDEEKFGYNLKNAYHLVRLIRMCKEILTTGKVIVKRPDREELLFIRNGGWTYDQIIEYSSKEDKEIDALYKESNILPHSPDIKFLDNMCIQLVEETIFKEEK